MVHNLYLGHNTSKLQLPKFSLEKIVNVKRESVFEIFSDFENYQELFPKYFPSVRIRSVRDNVAVVEEHMNLGGQELVIMAKHVTKVPISHEVYVIGGDVKGSYFKEEFIELSEGTKIIVDVDLRLTGKSKFLGIFGKTKFEKNYAEILDAFIKIVEK